MSTYSKRIDNKESFTNHAFRLFTDACGGDSRDFASAIYSKFTVEDFFLSDDFNYETILQYFKSTVVPHKIAVYQAGLEMSRAEWFKGIGIDKSEFLENLWLHDLSKFSANESYGYAFNDFSKKEVSVMFKRAWHHHKQFNPHHPEHWLNPGKGGHLEPLPMPKIYVVEMIADWIGAGKTYGSSLEEWLPNNLHNFLWHEETAQLVRQVLGYIGIETGGDGAVIYIKKD